MHIHRLRLLAEDLEPLRAFYRDAMGFPVESDSQEVLSIRSGASVLEFAVGRHEGCYHFAWNIPHDAVERAAAWLEARGIALLPMEGERIVEFPNWRARSVYFHDPAGNILEMIGRERVEGTLQGAFSPKHILGISEMGWPTHEMEALLHPMEQRVGLSRFWNPRPSFCALGDDHGLFIVVDAKEKLWIPTMVPARPLPFEMEFTTGEERWHLVFTDDGIVRLDRLAPAKNS